MVTGNFYYLKDSYYDKFPNCNLIGNKEDDVEGKHDRPCFYCFEKDGIYWMIPISSQIEKYEKLYNEKMQRYNGHFDEYRIEKNTKVVLNTNAYNVPEPLATTKPLKIQGFFFLSLVL